MKGCILGPTVRQLKRMPKKHPPPTQMHMDTPGLSALTALFVPLRSSARSPSCTWLPTRTLTSKQLRAAHVRPSAAAQSRLRRRRAHPHDEYSCVEGLTGWRMTCPRIYKYQAASGSRVPKHLSDWAQTVPKYVSLQKLPTQPRLQNKLYE